MPFPAVWGRGQSFDVENDFLLGGAAHSVVRSADRSNARSIAVAPAVRCRKNATIAITRDHLMFGQPVRSGYRIADISAVCVVPVERLNAWVFGAQAPAQPKSVDNFVCLGPFMLSRTGRKSSVR